MNTNNEIKVMEENEKKPITKCWTCGKELFSADEFIVVRWAPTLIGSYCHDCNPEDVEDD